MFKLRGNDFTPEQIRQWFLEEEHGYYDLTKESYNYGYAALNYVHSRRALRGRRFRHCLAFGCARGDEVAPFATVIDKIVAVEPEEEWWSDSIGGKPATFLKPRASGDIPLPDGSVDLVTCFGVLHHIPNVEHLLTELARVTVPGGILLLREPMSSMGDWTKPRKGLTKNERGIPPDWMLTHARGWRLRSFHNCLVSPLLSTARKVVRQPLNSRAYVYLDWFLAELLAWNSHYERDTLLKKLAPGSAFYVFERQRQ